MQQTIADAYATPGREIDERMDPEELPRLLQRCRVGLALIAPESRELAFENDRGNRRIAGLARTWSRSYGMELVAGFAVNPWREDAVAAGNAARMDGGRVLIVAPHRQGCLLTDQVWEPLLGWAEEQGVPVYVHAGPTAQGTPSQLFFVAQRHPRARFLLGRCGSTDYVADMRPVLDLAPRNVWYDTGFVRPTAMAAYAEAAPDRLCFASCAPQNDPAFEIALVRENVAPHRQERIFWSNFRGFLNL